MTSGNMNENYDGQIISGNQNKLNKNWSKELQIQRIVMQGMLEEPRFHGVHAGFTNQCLDFWNVHAAKNFSVRLHNLSDSMHICSIHEN